MSFQKVSIKKTIRVALMMESFYWHDLQKWLQWILMFYENLEEHYLLKVIDSDLR